MISKANQTCKWRLILDLSSPRHFSVNDGITPQWCCMHYAMAVGKIVQLRQKLSWPRLMSSMSTKIPHLPGMSFDIIDLVLPFGLCSALTIFSAIADAVEWR